MNLVGLLVVPLLGALTPMEMEYQATRRVVEEFERAGAVDPIGDSVLTDAARLLAKRALSNSAAEAGDQLSISEAISQALGHDANPHAYVIAGSPATEAIRSLLSNETLKLEGATHLGVGAVMDGDRGAIAIILPRRKSALRPFPRAFPKVGMSHTLCGELQDGLERPEVYVTRPAGGVDRLPLTVNTGTRFCVNIPFPLQGRHTVEVVGRGRGGPDIAALFFVDVGVASSDGARRDREREPQTLEEARKAILEKVNALRRANGVLEVIPDDDLNRIAQDYSEEMARNNFFAHVAPSGENLAARLKRGGFAFQAAGENLGLATGPLAAHFGIEHSPGHRNNLVDGTYGRIGIGVTFQRLADRTQALVAEVLASSARSFEVKVTEISGAEPFVYRRPPKVEPAPAELSADAYRLLAAQRAALKLPPLQRSTALDEIALAQARRALVDDRARSQLPLHSRVFAAQNELTDPAVEFTVYEVADPAVLKGSAGLANPAFDRVGIGIVKADSSASGKTRYWMIAVYATQS